MGIDAIKCEGYADVKEIGFGKCHEIASDLNGTDLLRSVAVLGLGIAVAGCISGPKEKEDEPVRLEYGTWRDRGVDVTLNAKQVGDETTFHSDVTSADYRAIFRGMASENGTMKAHFDILRRDPLNNSMEKQHVALDDYLKPETYNEAMLQYKQLANNGSTATVALLDFDGNRDFPGLKIIAYADIRNGEEVKLNLAEGHLKPSLVQPTEESFQPWLFPPIY